MDKETAIELAGSISNLARIICVSRTAVYSWGDALPDKYVWKLKLQRPEWFRDDARPRAEAESARMQHIVALADEIKREIKRWRCA